MDDMKRIYLEYELNATSPSAVWPIISEATGLERWMADEVERDVTGKGIGSYPYAW